MFPQWNIQANFGFPFKRQLQATRNRTLTCAARIRSCTANVSRPLPLWGNGFQATCCHQTKRQGLRERYIQKSPHATDHLWKLHAMKAVGQYSTHIMCMHGQVAQTAPDCHVSPVEYNLFWQAGHILVWQHLASEHYITGEPDNRHSPWATSAHVDEKEQWRWISLPNLNVRKMSNTP